MFRMSWILVTTRAFHGRWRNCGRWGVLRGSRKSKQQKGKGKKQGAVVVVPSRRDWKAVSHENYLKLILNF